MHVVETGCRVPVPGRLCTWWRQGAGCWVLGAGAGCWVPVLGAGAGCREVACRCSVLVLASDSEVITTAASDSEG